MQIEGLYNTEGATTKFEVFAACGAIKNTLKKHGTARAMECLVTENARRNQIAKTAEAPHKIFATLCSKFV